MVFKSRCPKVDSLEIFLFVFNVRHIRSERNVSSLVFLHKVKRLKRRTRAIQRITPAAKAYM